jgi:hypothetical protein
MAIQELRSGFASGMKRVALAQRQSFMLVLIDVPLGSAGTPRRWQEVQGSNHDTPYGSAYPDLSHGPAVLHVPPMAAPY